MEGCVARQRSHTTDESTEYLGSPCSESVRRRTLPPSPALSARPLPWDPRGDSAASLLQSQDFFHRNPSPPSPRPVAASSYYTARVSLSSLSAAMHPLDISRHTLPSSSSLSQQLGTLQQARTSRYLHCPPRSSFQVSRQMRRTTAAAATGKTTASPARTPLRAILSIHQDLGQPLRESMMEDVSPFTVDGQTVAHLPTYRQTLAQPQRPPPSPLAPYRDATCSGSDSEPFTTLCCSEEEVAFTAAETDEANAFFEFSFTDPSLGYRTIGSGSSGSESLHGDPLTLESEVNHEYAAPWRSCRRLLRSNEDPGSCRARSIIDSSVAKLFVRDGSRRQHFAGM